MRKIRTILTLSIIFLFTVLVFTATAKNGPHIGPVFEEETDACANCHRAHTAEGPKILAKGTNPYEFCTSCHNGTGANTNVVDGRFEGSVTTHASQSHGTPGAGLNGGGFESSFAYTGRQNRKTGWTSISSRHRVDGLDTDVNNIAWGGGDTGPGSEIALDCLSCHQPHGTENADGTERYRILENEVNNVEVGDIKSNETTKDYTRDQYRVGIGGFCAACHTQYLNKSSVYSSGDNKGSAKRYRHSINGIKMGDGSTASATLAAGEGKTGNGKTIVQNLNEHTALPVEQDAYSATHSGSDKLTCLTCHQAHGTNIGTSDASTVDPANSAVLLRLKGRGVCQDCHQR